LVKIIPEPSATRSLTCSKSLGQNIEIAITPPRIARLHSNLVLHVTGNTLQMFKVKGQGHSVK